MLYSTATVALLAGMLPMASAHYFMDKLVLPNGQVSADYVRQNTRQTKYYPTKWKNTFDNTTPDSIDFRCNVGATNKGAPKTAAVKPGDALALKLAVGATMRHPGPLQVYMSKAPTTAAAYDGSGGWFKIHQEGICRTNGDIKGDAWCSWDKGEISFKIPFGIPDGEYLVRAEHIGVHGAHDGQAEFYYACAQVSLSGGSGSIPSDTVKIPGVYKVNDPEVNFSVWGGMKPYPAKGPGPAVFSPSAASNETPASPAPASSPSPSAAPKPVSSGAPAVPVVSPAPVSSAAPIASPAPPAGGNPPADDDYPPVGGDSPTVGQPAKPKPSCPGLAKARRHARDLAH